MLARNLLIGVSVLAVAAGAEAETRIVGSNVSEVLQRGPDNIAQVDNGAPGNDDNFSSVVQDGAGNRARIEQIGDRNESFAFQDGDVNTLIHLQIGNRNEADTDQIGDRHTSSIAQAGDRNYALAIQLAGDRNRSTITQGAPGSAAFAAAAEVTQAGSDNESDVSQLGFHNNVLVVQGGSRIASNGNRSAITQRQSGQTAELFQFGGSTAAPNLSSIAQENRITGGPDFNSSNRASVSMRGFGNESAVAQNGDTLLASISIVGGATAGGGPLDPETARSEGNRSFVAQTGRALTAFVSAGALRHLPGRGNLSTIEQSGNAGLGEPRLSHLATVWQRGLFETSAILQADGSATRPVQQPINYRDGSRGRATADVSQSGARGFVDVQQFADNFARVTQGLGSRGRVRIEQVDAGDYEVGIAIAPGSTLRAFNSADVAQYGDNNIIDIAQDSVGATAIVFQRRGSFFNSAAIRQGVSGPDTGPDTAIRSATVNLTAVVTQGGSRNLADIGQWGIFLGAEVDQSGSGTAALPNRVQVRQRGRGNRATAEQGVHVGPSNSSGPSSGQMGDEFFFAGGARSAEIAIIQSNIGNSASVAQHGRGQFALIEQSGPRNRASILQEFGATNATAVIRQSGSDNSYGVIQTQPGQYLVVSQSGSNNSVTDVVRRGPGG